MRFYHFLIIALLVLSGVSSADNIKSRYVLAWAPHFDVTCASWQTIDILNTPLFQIDDLKKRFYRQSPERPGEAPDWTWETLRDELERGVGVVFYTAHGTGGFTFKLEQYTSTEFQPYGEYENDPSWVKAKQSSDALNAAFNQQPNTICRVYPRPIETRASDNYEKYAYDLEARNEIAISWSQKFSDKRQCLCFPTACTSPGIADAFYPAAYIQYSHETTPLVTGNAWAAILNRMLGVIGDGHLREFTKAVDHALAYSSIPSYMEYVSYDYALQLAPTVSWVCPMPGGEVMLSGSGSVTFSAPMDTAIDASDILEIWSIGGTAYFTPGKPARWAPINQFGTAILFHYTTEEPCNVVVRVNAEYARAQMLEGTIYLDGGGTITESCCWVPCNPVIGVVPNKDDYYWCFHTMNY